MKATRVDTRKVLDELARLAEIAAGVIDGEDVKGVITPRAMYYILNPDPKHQFLVGDYFDVDHDLFLRVKKLMIRIARLSDLVISSSMWQVIGDGKRTTVVLHNGAMQQWYHFGDNVMDIPPELAEVARTGQVKALPVTDGDRQATALAPIRDSLGDVVAVCEFSAPLAGQSPAWS
ncbi:MAG TPA: hypothetical protein VFJ30_00015 [Phycisphaerae bacterium]|nr:hypothetical protein [Phycisphaerae bacterium]